MGEAVDSKKLLSKNHRVWRCLQAPGDWGQFYRDRQKALENYRSAIVFPEQVIGLEGHDLFIVNNTKSGVVSTSIGIVRGVTIGTYQETFGTIQDVYDYELENQSQQAINSLMVRYPGSLLTSYEFSKFAYFSSRKEAVKFAQRFIEAAATKLC